MYGGIIIDKIFGLIGLAKRAGKVSCGEAACKDAIRIGKSRLVLLASDASKNTEKSIENSCKYYGVYCCKAADKETLGKAVGNDFNAALSINDDGFARNIIKHIKANNKESE